MKKMIVLLTGALILASCDNSDGAKRASEESARYEIPLTAQSVKVNEQTQQFSFNFLRAYSNAANVENYCISPLSASLCLGMVLNGASGNTYTEMQKVLGYEGFSNADINEYAKALQTELPKLDNFATFTNANSIWLRNDFNVLSSFVDVNKENYDAEVKSVPFNTETVNKINEWCSNKTNKKIPSIIDKMNSDLKVCLINAIYFKAPWKDKFETSATKDRPFYKADGTSENVPTMYLNKNVASYTDEEVTIAELPYGNGAFDMVFFMPTNSSKTSLEKLISGLDATKWNNWLSQLSSAETKLTVPSFEMTSSGMDLIQTFRTLGMNDAFDGASANFSKMSDESLFINMLLQKTYIKVNEEGTEAAAVTFSGMTATAYGPSEEPRIIYFNHPFGFVLRETSTGAILFAGKCGNPKK